MEELPLHRTQQARKVGSVPVQGASVQSFCHLLQCKGSLYKMKTPHPKSSLAHWTEERMEFQLPAQGPWFCSPLFPPLTGLPTANRNQSLGTGSEDTLEKVPMRTVLFSEMAAAP